MKRKTKSHCLPLQEFDNWRADRPRAELRLRRVLHLLRLLHLLLLLHHDQPLRRRHHGQLRLSDQVLLLFSLRTIPSSKCQGLFYSGLAPSWRVHHLLGGDRSQRRVSSRLVHQIDQKSRLVPRLTWLCFQGQVGWGPQLVGSLLVHQIEQNCGHLQGLA